MKDIPSASLDGRQIHLFGLASQFNGAEAVGPFTPPPGEAVRASENDKTQGQAGRRTNQFVFELSNQRRINLKIATQTSTDTGNYSIRS